MLMIFFALPVSALTQEIHEAARQGDTTKVKALLEKDPELVNAKDKNGRTPLHWAARGVHLEIIRLLISKGVDVNTKDNNNITALHSTASRGHKEATKLLIENGAKMDGKQTESGWTPLIYATYNGHKEIVNLLLSKGADPNIKNNYRNTALDYAVLLGHKEIVNLLISSRVIKIPIKGEEGRNLLGRAASGGHKELVELMISKGADVNHQNHYHLTPLHLAASNGRLEMVDLLLKNGADINAKSYIGRTALQFAAENNHNDVVEFLIAKGADNNFSPFPVFKGEYLGQKKPGTKPEIFALEIVSSFHEEHGTAALTQDGKEFYWPRGYDLSVLLFMKLENNQWTIPQVISFSSQFRNINPALTYDGQKLFFASTRPLEKNGEPGDYNIWFAERKGTGWSEPEILDSPINSPAYEGGPFVAKDSSLYFISTREGGYGHSDIYCSRRVNGQYTAPKNLGVPINSKYLDAYPYIPPDGSYIIFESSRPGGFGDRDLYISYRKKDGTWGEAINMGDRINSSARDTFPRVSPDGKFFFFGSDRNGNLDIYWIDAKIIDELKPKFPLVYISSFLYFCFPCIFSSIFSIIAVASISTSLS